MSTYALTKARIFQYIGILLVLAFVAAGYWYFAVRAGVKTNSGAVQPQGTDDLSAGLAAYFKLDENTGTSAADSSTNAVTAGTLTNGPTWTTGRIGSAVDFDGTNDYITIPDNDALDFGDTDNMTLTGWFNRDTFTTFDFIMAKNDGVNPGYRIYIDDTADNLHFAVFDGTDMYTLDGFNMSFTTSGWHHFAVVWDQDSPDASEIYVDGVGINATDDGTIGLVGSLANSLALSIGDEIGYNQPFDGKLDEIRIYDRVLSPDTIAKLYQTTVPTGVDTSLKGYWSFDGQDIDGTLVADRSGVGSTGTLTNGPTIVRGQLGQALNFDGTNDYVDAGSATSIDDIVNLTACSWINPETVPGSYAAILAKYNGYGWAFEIDNHLSTRNLMFYRDFSSAGGWWNGPAVSYSEWTHVCVTYNNASVANDPVLYMNGVAVPITEVQTPVGTPVNETNGPLNGGAAWDGAAFVDYFDGKLDEARVYSRILTDAEIKSLYDLGQSDKANTSASQPQGTGRLDSGLAGYWKLDENTGTSATDSSTNGNTGTVPNSWTTGQVGSAVSFNGSTGMTASAYVIDNKQDVTLSAWVYPRTAGGYRGWLYKGPSGCDEATAKYMLENDVSGYLRFWMGGVSSSLTTTTTLATNQWQHITATNSAAGSAIYLNGNRIASGSTLPTPATSSETWYFNRCNYIDANMDEIRIYSRALSADEVSQLYRLTSPTGTDTGLKGYWSFNGQDMSGTTAYDRSGAGNTGTLTNGPAITEGKLGQALSFDGANDSVTLATGPIVTGEVSVFVWIKPSAIGAKRDIIADMTAGNTPGAYYLFMDSSGKINAQWGGFSSFCTGSTVLSANAWYHVGFIRSGSTGNWTCKSYVNGVQDSTASSIATNPNNQANYSIGNAGAGSNPFSGVIDEVRVYNRALSVAEIKALYSSGK